MSNLFSYSKLPIDRLSDLCEAYLAEKIQEFSEDSKPEDIQNFVKSVHLRELILTCAECKSYGIGETPLSIWEILNPTLYMTPDRKKSFLA